MEFQRVLEFWVVSDSSAWRTWIGGRLGYHGLSWRALGSEEFLKHHDDWPDVVIADGALRRPRLGGTLSPLFLRLSAMPGNAKAIEALDDCIQKVRG